MNSDTNENSLREHTSSAKRRQKIQVRMVHTFFYIIAAVLLIVAAANMSEEPIVYQEVTTRG